MKLERLAKIDIRECWQSEANDFTPWLAEEENIKLLGDTIGLELEVEAQEKEVGLFRADLLCRDTVSDNWVLIENQLERTDHTHLGQLLTYAAGLHAVTIVWIAKRFSDEHRATLDWLNEITDEKFNFFGLEVELWKIGDSAIAPKFNLTCQPNNWSKTIAGETKSFKSSDYSEGKQLQLEFWSVFGDLAKEQATHIKATKARPQHWMNIAVGRSGCKLSAMALFRSLDHEKQGEIRASLIMHSADAEQYFEALYQFKEEIEEESHEEFIWENKEGIKRCQIYLSTAADITQRSNWLQQQIWLLEKLDKMYAVFSPRLRKLKS